MDVFERIDKLRRTHSFPSKLYRTALKKEDLGVIRKLESNTSKYFDLGSVNYLKRNRRIIKKQENSPFLELYSKYTESLISKDTVLLVEIRTALQKYTSFVEELDAQLSSLDYDISKLKYKHTWNDLEILFSAEEKIEEFNNRTLYVKDTKYNSLLVKNIFNIENRREQLDKLVSKDSSRIRCILSKTNILYKSIEDFISFLKENYVDSEYLKSIRDGTKSLKEYYESLAEGKKIENYKIPEYFKNISEQIVNSSKGLEKDKKKIKKEILEELERYLSTSTAMNVPFIPDFYDIAFDYIKYPPVEEKVEEAFRNLNFS
ncbi:hypothetical protein NGRA_3351 [Nosema granulosis]|uniref:Uncharacterized protein n=1 Tax=Nosema granulosis TaxID=83296 RepID=A0A9P6GVE7_9MICR|nr:hypothetical protein NGRA_3351 [Nosema granulosis]